MTAKRVFRVIKVGEKSTEICRTFYRQSFPLFSQESSKMKLKRILLGETVSAIQQTKKKAKQALCTKLIKKFKLLDLYRGEGASERLDIGSHTNEMEIVLDDGDTKMEVMFQ